MKEIRSILEEKQKYYREMKSKIEKAAGHNKQKGRLRVIRSHGTFQYYLCVGKGDTNGRYIRKRDRKLAEEIAQRDYDVQMLKCISEWDKWIEQTKNAMPSVNPADIYEASPGRKPLIKPYEISDDEYAENWKNAVYKGKEFAADAMEIYSENGIRVRSKSEKIIADKLSILGIPYRYEYPLKLQGYGIVYPDFLLLNKRTRKEYILEHFGMMDDADYSRNAVKKINMYAKNGYVLGFNLLATFEMMDAPLDVRVFEKMMETILS